jgi:flagellar biosynthesis/type III secretory pathway M-ring protein FliF/YscJ
VAAEAHLPLLQADLDPETMGQVCRASRCSRCPYELDEGGRGIRVPASRIDELRLEFAQSGNEAGLPGWKLFDGRTSASRVRRKDQVPPRDGR